MNNNIKLTDNILRDNGFYSPDCPECLAGAGLQYLEYCTEKEDGNNHITITVSDNRWVNSFNDYSIHIDNCDMETVASCDMSYIWQFNSLMNIVGSKYRIAYEEEK